MTGTHPGAERRRFKRLRTEAGVAGHATVQVACQVVRLTKDTITLQVPVKPPAGTRCEVVLDAGEAVELRSRVQAVSALFGTQGPYQVVLEIRSMRPDQRAALEGFLLPPGEPDDSR